MKKRTLTPYVLTICLGLLLSIGGLFDGRIAFCQPEEEEPIQTRPRPEMLKNPLDKQKAMNPAGRMRVNPTKNKQKTIADDGQHGDGIQPSMRPGGPTQDIVADDGQHGDGLEPSMRPIVPKRKLNPKSPDIR